MKWFSVNFRIYRFWKEKRLDSRNSKNDCHHDSCTSAKPNTKKKKRKQKHQWTYKLFVSVTKFPYKWVSLIVSLYLALRLTYCFCITLYINGFCQWNCWSLSREMEKKKSERISPHLWSVLMLVFHRNILFTRKQNNEHVAHSVNMKIGKYVSDGDASGEFMIECGNFVITNEYISWCKLLLNFIPFRRKLSALHYSFATRKKSKMGKKWKRANETTMNYLIW